MKRFLVTVSLVAALVFGMSMLTNAGAVQVPGQQPTAQPQGQSPQQAQPASITGKVTAVSGRTFAIEVGEGATKKTMQFITDANTAMAGQLKVGSTATVQYHTGAGNQNLATRVEVEG
jgi:hypothetical protein